MLANSIEGAPNQNSRPALKNGKNAYKPKPKPEVTKASEPQKKSRHRGLYLRFSSKADGRIEKAKIITSIFEGDLPLHFYYLMRKV